MDESRPWSAFLETFLKSCCDKAEVERGEAKFNFFQESRSFSSDLSFPLNSLFQIQSSFPLFLLSFFGSSWHQSQDHCSKPNFLAERIKFSFWTTSSTSRRIFLSVMKSCHMFSPNFTCPFSFHLDNETAHNIPPFLFLFPKHLAWCVMEWQAFAVDRATPRNYHICSKKWAERKKRRQFQPAFDWTFV